MTKEEYKVEVRLLSNVIHHLDGVLVPIEEALGLEEPDNEKQLCYGDLPRRLDQLIGYLVGLGHRLEIVQKTVITLRDTVS